MATSKRKNPETRFPHGFIINGKLVDIGDSVHHIWAANRLGLPDPRLSGSEEEDDAIWDGMRKRWWIRLTSDYSDVAFGGVDFLGELTDKRLRLVQDVLDREGVVVEGVVVEDFDIPVPFQVFMNVRSIGELKNAMDSNRSPHLSEAWARKAARERGIEENPVKRGGKSPMAKRKCYLVQIHEGHAPKKFLPGDWVLWKNCRDMDECRDVALQRHIRIRGGVTKPFTVNIYVGSADDVGYDGNPRTAQVTEYRVEPQRLEDVLLPYEVNWARDRHRRVGAKGGD